LGKALLAQFEAAARKAGAEVAFLEVAAGNSAARALYKQAGWHETGRRPAYYRSLDGHWEDAMILSLNL
jgi:ribosomal-protein-alanine N-acetyltransferase